MNLSNSIQHLRHDEMLWARSFQIGGKSFEFEHLNLFWASRAFGKALSFWMKASRFEIEAWKYVLEASNLNRRAFVYFWRFDWSFLGKASNYELHRVWKFPSRSFQLQLFNRQQVKCRGKVIVKRDVLKWY